MNKVISKMFLFENKNKNKSKNVNKDFYYAV